MALSRRSPATSVAELLVPLLVVIAAASRFECRELRPSDHGLDNQAVPGPASPAMRSFFGGPTPADVQLPMARNSTAMDGEFWTPGPGRSRDSHVRVVLLVVSVACGSAGLVLLIAGGVLYFVRRNKQQ